MRRTPLLLAANTVDARPRSAIAPMPDASAAPSWLPTDGVTG